MGALDATKVEGAAPGVDGVLVPMWVGGVLGLSKVDDAFGFVEMQAVLLAGLGDAKWTLTLMY